MTRCTTPLPLVLASRSPRRRELLERIGLRLRCVPADIDESIVPRETPAVHVERLAREKGLRVAGRDDAVVVSADTVVVLDGRILGQPADDVEATMMLRALSGREHEVYTGCAVFWRGRSAAGVEAVRVTFRTLSDEEIRWYVGTGEPRDKAGAYGIQGSGAVLVRRIDGDYTAVVGMPLPLMLSCFAALGLRFGPDGVVPA
ncbi:MAG: septum formation inhibitor Maf [Armatimonadetes bacterium]|nr:septum formation inhibitor Maf [Armatimonadota bacterium]